MPASPVCPPLPNASVDFNALNDACKAGKAEEALKPEALLVPEHPDTAAAALKAAAAEPEIPAKPAAKPAAGDPA